MHLILLNKNMNNFSKKTNIQKVFNKESKPKLYVFESQRKSFKTGRDIQPKKDLTRFIKWPTYIQVQRDHQILRERLKIPPMINQFSRSLDKNMTKQLFFALEDYKNNFNNNQLDNKNTIYIKHGINVVTNLIQKKKALFVVIANDVSPIELVVWLPTLCQKMDVPYCIIQNKSTLGKLVNKKKTSCIAVTSFINKYKEGIEKLIDCFRLNFNNRYEEGKKRWGGGVISKKRREKT